MPRVDDATIRLSKSQAEKVVAEFELDGGISVDEGTVHLLERYFLENKNDRELSHRYDEALGKHKKKA